MLNVLIRGGGDLATGVAVRLHRCGFGVTITELEKPLSVRRKVSFSEAIYEGKVNVEGIDGVCVNEPIEALQAMAFHSIPVFVDPEFSLSSLQEYSVLIDARLMKEKISPRWMNHKFAIGLGPGFTAGENCDAAVETERGHTLGRVIWVGSTNADTGLPEGDPRRVFRAPCDGVVRVIKDIGEHVEEGELMAAIADTNVNAPLRGVLRGMIRNGVFVKKGVKLGDVDPRDNPAFCYQVSDKAFSVAGGVLEAILVHLDRTNNAG